MLARVWLEPLRLSSPAAQSCAHDHHLPSRPPTLAPYLLPLIWSVSACCSLSCSPAHIQALPPRKLARNSHVSGIPYRLPFHALNLHFDPPRRSHDVCYRSEPYDPYLPRGGSSSNPAGPAGNAKTAAIQAQIDDTVGIMRENITKVAERGERLDQLQDKTGELHSLVRFARWFHLLAEYPQYLLPLRAVYMPSAVADVMSSYRQPRRIRAGIPSRREPCTQGMYRMHSLNSVLPLTCSPEYVVCTHAYQECYDADRFGAPGGRI